MIKSQFLKIEEDVKIMRKHGDNTEVLFGFNFPVNVCKNPECGQEFILLKVMDSGEVWEQIGNGMGKLHCPYCKEKVGVK